MTKTLQEIQEFNRRKIICAVNGTENYQEALKLEYAEKGNNTISSKETQRAIYKLLGGEND
jgi:hypothetical protein